MKRSSIITGAVLALSLTACQKELQGPEEQRDHAFAITATRESCADDAAVDTKATINDAKLSWSAGESIGIYNGEEFISATTLEGGEKAKFTSSSTITPSNYAVYPTLSAKVDGASLKVTLPDKYENYTSGAAYPAMLATFEDTPSSLYFKHIGGLVKFNVTNLPKSITKFVFTTTNNMPITGEFTVGDDGGNKVIKSVQTEGAEAKTVTFTFSNTEDYNNMEFYLPLPVLASDAKYQFQIDFLTDAGVSIYGSTPRTGWVNIERGKYFTFDLSFKDYDGGAESGVTSVTLSSDVTDYALPSTDGTVNVTMEGNTNNVTLHYTSEGVAPAYVNILCKGNIGKADATSPTGLTVNLPKSHVEIKKADGVSSDVTINVLKSITSNSTLVLDKSISEVKTLTVEAGSAEIASPKVETVTVEESVADDATVKVTDAAAKVTSLTVNKGNVEIAAGTVTNVTVASTVAETATVKVAAEAKVEETLSVAKAASVEVSGEVKNVAVETTVNNVTIAAKVETVTVSTATSSSASPETAPVIWVTESGRVTESVKDETTTEENTSKVTVVAAKGQASGTGESVQDGQVAKVVNSSNQEVKDAVEDLSRMFNNGETTLEKDIKGYFTIAKGNTVTINLAGHAISNGSTNPTFTVEEGATLIINGSGSVTNTAAGKPVIVNNGTLKINGGTYNTAAAGQNLIENASGASLTVGNDVELATVKNSDGTISAYVASETAINAAIADANIAKIVLTKDIALEKTVTINTNGRKVVIDMNNHNITAPNKTVEICHADVEFTGTGVIEETVDVKGNYAFAALGLRGATTDQANYTVVTVGSGITLKGYSGLGVGSDEAGGKSYNNYGIVVNFSGKIERPSKFESDCFGIYLNGLNVHTTGNVPVFNIDGATINAANVGIYAAGYAKWNIKGSTSITGTNKTAIEIRAGEMTIENGTYTSNARTFKQESNGDGETVTGAALAVSQHTTNLPINVTLNGGTFTGVYALYENDIEGDKKGENVSVTKSANVTLNGSVYSQHNTSWNTEGVADEASLVAAIAAEDVNTISLATDITISDKLVINTDKNLVIDLNGKTLSGRTNITKGKVTFKNGTIAGGKEQALNVYGSSEATAKNYSVLTVSKDVKVTADDWAVCIFGATATTNGYGAVANLYGTIITTGDGTEGSVFVSGNLGQNEENFAVSATNTVTISGSVTSQNDAAIVLNGAATVKVNSGAVITGNTAIAVKRGKLIVNKGSKITGNGACTSSPAVNNNGAEMSGSAILATDTYSQYGPLSVEINGGEFTSKAFTILNNSACEFNISGGTFTSTLADDAIAVWARLGSINISGGTFETGSNNEATLYVGTEEKNLLDGVQPKLTVSGTTTIVKNTATGQYKYNTALAPLAVNMWNGLGYKAVEISGGTFYGNNPSRDDAVTGDNGNFLAEGYGVCEEQRGVYTVCPASGDALAAQLSVAGATVKVSENITLANALSSGKNTTLEVAENVVITGKGQTSGSAREAILTSNNLTLKGKGKIVADISTDAKQSAVLRVGGGIVNIYDGITLDGGSGHSGNYAVRIVKGTVNIYGGYFRTSYNGTAGTDGNKGELIYLESAYASSSKCVLNISGGVFECDGDATYLINCQDTYKSKCTISITGGTFVGFNPADNSADGEHTNYCASGYTTEKITYNGKDAWKVVEQAAE